MVSKDKISEGYYHCLDFFERNYPKATVEERNWYLIGVIALRDYLQQK